MEKIEGEPLGDFKKFLKKKFKMRFLNRVTVPKNVKGGTLWNFFDIPCVAKCRNKRRGDSLVQSKNFQKKSHSAEKNPSGKEKGFLSMFSVSEIRDVDVFASDVF